jgi:hypothetical protein
MSGNTSRGVKIELARREMPEEHLDEPMNRHRYKVNLRMLRWLSVGAGLSLLALLISLHYRKMDAGTVLFLIASVAVLLVGGHLIRKVGASICNAMLALIRRWLGRIWPIS